MPLIKVGKHYYNGAANDVYLMQGNAVRDAETKQAGRNLLACVSIAAAKREDESAVFVTLNGWRDRMGDVAAIRKGDSVLAIGILKQREYNEKTYFDMDAEFVCQSGAGLIRTITQASGDDAHTQGNADFEASLEDVDVGELPF